MSNGKPRFVVVRPDFEDATHWGAWHFNDKVVRYATELGLPFTDLYSALARRWSFVAEMGNPDTVFICGVGHGNPTVFTGDQQDILLSTLYPQDFQLMQQKHGSFLSCSWGQAAQQFVSNGMASFMGYTEDYYFTISEFPNSEAEMFFSSHCTYDQKFLAGIQPTCAFAEMINRYNEVIATADVVSARYLIADRDSAILLYNIDWSPFTTDTEPKPPCPDPRGPASQDCLTQFENRMQQWDGQDIQYLLSAITDLIICIVNQWFG